MKHALIYAGGLGTRLKPLTNNINKCMVEVNGKPVLEHIVDNLNKYFVTNIIIKTHYRPKDIYSYFGDRLLYFYEPKLTDEAETFKKLRNTWFKYKEVIVANGDTLTDINVQFMRKKGKNNRTGVRAMEKGVYTGTTYYHVDDDRLFDWQFGNKWLDVGSPEKLEQARKEWK